MTAKLNHIRNLQYKRQMNREMAEGLKQMVDDEKEKKEREEEEARKKKEADLLLPGAAEAAAAAELKRLKVGWFRPLIFRRAPHPCPRITRSPTCLPACLGRTAL